MKPANPLPANRPLNLQHWVRWVLAASISLMLVFGQTTSVSAGSSGWIEICGDGETRFIQLNGETEESGGSDSCSHCELCLVQSSSDLGVFTPVRGVKIPEDFTQFTQFSSQAPFVARAEQFWAANRGPPIKSEEMTMTTFLRLTTQAGMPHSLGGTP